MIDVKELYKEVEQESEKMQKANPQPWLVYLVSSCEMGSEGWSGWCYYCVAFGDTDEEIYNNWVENVKLIYGVDLSNDLKEHNGYWSCYYPIYKNQLPTSVYGDSQPLLIEKCFRKHIS